MTIREDVGTFLASHADEGYRAFQAKLIPNIDAATIVGVRTPELRKFAKGLARREDAGEFLAALPHGTFEENQLHSFVIAQERDFDKLVGEIERFLPFVDNWATCDQLSCRGLAANPDAALAKARSWLESDHEYTVRFAIGVLMELLLALPQNQPNAPLYPAGGAPGSRPGALPHFGRPRYLGPPPRARSTAG